MGKNLKKTIGETSVRRIANDIREELGDETTVTVSIKPKISRTEDFVMVYQAVGKKILEDKMALTTIKVFYYLIMNLEFQNFIGININTLAEKINLSIPSVNRAMKELKDANILLATKDSFDARRNIYRINPLSAWKGKARNRNVEVKENPNQLTLYSERNT